MWYNNKAVHYVYEVHGSQMVWATIEGVTGWKRVKPGSADGVTNVGILLSVAKANGRRVNVDIDGDQIIRVVML